MRWVLIVLCALCVSILGTLPMAEGDIGAEITVTNADQPGINAILPYGNISISILLHDEGAPYNGTAVIYIQNPDGYYAPVGIEFDTAGGNGWYNSTMKLANPYPGTYTFSVCNSSLGDGWKGQDGFFLNSTTIDLVGIATDKLFYTAGEWVAFDLLTNDTLVPDGDVGLLQAISPGQIIAYSTADHVSGAFQVPTNAEPGLYTIETDVEDIAGSFAVSDIQLFPSKDVYSIDDIILVSTALEDLSAKLISPAGETLVTKAVSGPTNLDLGALQLEDGDHLLVVTSGGVQVHRQSLHISCCDLWVELDEQVYIPGTVAKLHFNAKDISEGIKIIESLNWDIVYYTNNGPTRVSQTLQQTSGVLPFTIPTGIVSGEYLWSQGTDNRVELSLNLSIGLDRYQVRRVVPIPIGAGSLAVEGGSNFESDQAIDLMLKTKIEGSSPTWTASTIDGDLSSNAPPIRAGQDPFGRPVYRFSHREQVATSIDVGTEDRSSPMRFVDVSTTLAGIEEDWTTDFSGSIRVELGPLDEGRYTLVAESDDDDLPSSASSILVLDAPYGIEIDAPESARSGDGVEIIITPMEGDLEILREVVYTIGSDGTIMKSGTLKDSDNVAERTISLNMPNSTEDVVVSAFMGVGGLRIESEHTISVQFGPLYAEKIGGLAAPGETVQIMFDFENQTKDHEISFDAGDLGSGVVAGPSGTFDIDVPQSWSDDWFDIIISATEDGRSTSTSIRLFREGDVAFTMPKVEERTRFNLTFEIQPPSPAYNFVKAFYGLASSNGSITSSGSIIDETGEIPLNLSAGSYTISIQASYLTQDGILTFTASAPVHVSEAEVQAPPEEDDDDDGGEMDIWLYVSLMLLVLVIILLILLFSARKRLNKARTKLWAEEEVEKKLKHKIEELEDLLPEEEGIEIPDEVAKEMERASQALPEDAGSDEVPPEEGEPEPEPATEAVPKSTGGMIEEAPCPMCEEPLKVQARRPVNITCASCGFDFTVE